MDVGRESMIGSKPVDGRRDDIRAHFGNRSTRSAHEMNVLGVIGDVIGRGAVTQMGVGDERQLFEQIERAINGRDVDAVRGFAHPRQDVVGCGMPKGGDRLEHQLPLRSEPVTPRAQLPLPAAALACFDRAHKISLGAHDEPERPTREASALVPEEILAGRAIRVNKVPEQRQRKALRQEAHRRFFGQQHLCTHDLMIGRAISATDPPMG